MFLIGISSTIEKKSMFFLKKLNFFSRMSIVDVRMEKTERKKMESWMKTTILKNCSEKKAAEVRTFMIAYGELDDEYHGYLSSITKGQQVWYKSLEPADLKEIKKEGFNVYNVTYGKGGLNLSLDIPYLSLDGLLAMANDEHREFKLDIKQEILFGNSDPIGVKVILTSELRGIKESIANIENTKDGKVDFESISSTALRKALNLMGYGRFPRHTTAYGGDKIVKEFREFKKKSK